MMNHICGCYFRHPTAYPPRTYLPQVDVKAHATILSTTSRTALTQTFVNPDESKGIKELRYTFPLYDGVSVVGFECNVGDRTITGEVKEKEQAKKTYDDAVSKGQVAGLLEQLPEASDVFTTTIGNIPPKATIVVHITYLGELKHDIEADGVRYTIPTIIYPRYGSYPGALLHASEAQSTGFNVTVDAALPDGFCIREIKSPSHPISVSLGVISTASEETPSMNKASATLGISNGQLEKDFVLQVVAKEFANPSAVLETHPTIPGSRAIMTTLVPRFQLPRENPELVFVCDRSGSMSGGKITALRNSLNVFLKSLPIGVMFNICSFGSRHDFLWSKSKPYNQDNLNAAINHVSTFSADYGGTEMYKPIQQTMKRRFPDRSLEVFLVTDGEIWDQQQLFDLINQQVQEKKHPIRIFTLGVGDSVSHALIEGVARAGNGFSQSVGEQEKLDKKVVRMLKAALTPHITDYKLEIKYENDDPSDDDLELVEKVDDCLRVNLCAEGSSTSKSDHKSEKVDKSKKSFHKKVFSLFDPSADPDAADDKDKDPKQMFAHLPPLPEPKLLQAPHKIPPLYPFTRATVYILMSPDTPQTKPKSVILRGTSKYGPLELEIPVTHLASPGETLHQLAARKTVQGLEEGCGWVHAATDAGGKALKKQFPSVFDEMVQREAVRLGVRFQVGGKWCSFVAVEKEKDVDREMSDWDFLDAMDSITLNEAQMDPSITSVDKPRGIGHTRARKSSLMPLSSRSNARAQFAGQQTAVSSIPTYMAQAYSPTMSQILPSQPQSSLCNAGGAPASLALHYCNATDVETLSKPPTGAGHSTMRVQPTPRPFFSAQRTQPSDLYSPPIGSSFMPRLPGFTELAKSSDIEDDLDMEVDSEMAEDSKKLGGAMALSMPAPKSTAWRRRAPDKGAKKKKMAGTLALASEDDYELPADEGTVLQQLVELQSFEGAWDFTPELLRLIGGVDGAVVKKECPSGVDKRVLATALAVRFFEKKMMGEKESWELLVEKARAWLEGSVNADVLGKVFEAVDKVLR